MRRALIGLLLVVAGTAPALADVRITKDYGGYVDRYKTNYARIRDAGERIIIDGTCNSACTLLLGIVPRAQVCATPRARLGFHQAYYDKRWTAGVRITSIAGTAELMAIYPPAVKDWIRRQGGLGAEMKYLKSGPDLWAIVDPCPDEF
jgi:hypothetical protein